MKTPEYDPRTLKPSDTTKLESIAEILEGLEERRERIQNIKSRGWV